MSIISFQNNFVFVKTKKVAGTSVEALLRRYTGPDDTVPPITPRDEHFCISKGLYSRNYLKERQNEKAYIDLVAQGSYDEAREYLKGQKKIASSHMNISQCTRLIESSGRSVSEFFSFTIERHPYSWLLSSVLYNNDQYHSTGAVNYTVDSRRINYNVAKLMEKPEFLDAINWKKYSIDNNVQVDRVLNYDSIYSQLNEVLAEMGLESSVDDLPELKSNSRHLNAFDILDSENKRKAQEIFAPVFDLMGFKI